MVRETGVAKVPINYESNTETGEQSVVIEDDSMQPTADSEVPLGINGIKIFNGFVYFTANSRQQFCRVPINSDSTAPDPIRVVANHWVMIVHSS